MAVGSSRRLLDQTLGVMAQVINPQALYHDLMGDSILIVLGAAFRFETGGENPAMPMLVYDVAKYFLSLTDDESGDTISNLKLQKLLYYAQGFHLVMFGQPLFENSIEAWRHGPVVKGVYRDYAQHGSNSIPRPTDFNIETIDEETRDFLDEVYKIYGQYSAWRLRQMIHDEPPWQEAWARGESSVVQHRAMQDYFKTLIDED